MSDKNARRAWLASLAVGSVVDVSEYNGAPESSWLRRTVARIEPVTLTEGPTVIDPEVRVESEDALWLDDGARFARSDGRCLCIYAGRRVWFGMNERLEVPRE